MPETKFYPKIPQFRQFVANATKAHQKRGYEEGLLPGTPMEPIQVTGSVKIHGTNAGILLEDGELVALSRKRRLTLQDDNYGFAAWVHQNAEDLMELFWDTNEGTTYWGEWCGKGIQAGVAVSELPRRWVVFPGQDLVTVPECVEVLPVQYACLIDFIDLTTAQKLLAECTQEVEDCCPYALYHGVKGVGEGIVWTDVETGLKFKTKGDKHRMAKTKAKVEIDPQKAADVAEFCEMVCTDARCEQMAEGLSLEPKNIGEYLRRVTGDVFAEETDRIVASGLDAKAVKKALPFFAKKWWGAASLKLPQLVG